MPTKAPPSAPGAEGPVLTGDRKIAFPEFFILSASAGAGKTHALSLRFVQFLLSGRIRELTPNDLPNIMAMTFTRNAAREMKERILGWLKECSRGEARRIKAIQDVVSAPSATLERLAGETVDRILDRYSDFQVDTIDHFTGAVFRASAVDLGVSPDFETILEPSETISYAFSRYLRKIRAGSPEGAVFERILELLFRNQPGERPFDWDPAPKVREYINNLSGRLAAQEGSLVLDDLDAEKEALERQMREAAEELGSLVESAGLEKRARGHCFSKIIPAVSGGDFAEVIKASFKSVPVSKPVAGRGSARGEPGRGSKSKAEGAVPDAAEAYERVMGLWGRLESLVKAYRPLYARSFYHPYLMAYQSFLRTLEQVKRQRGVVFIDDINHKLSRYLDRGLVPDIYFRLGDRVFHFLIDEFQDTSPIQWKNLIPLIENSLAQAGSLFVVGDTKQAIYGFRDADYRIMADLEQAARRVGDSRDPAGLNPFLSVAPVMGRLETNYRSRREILDFVKDKFLVASEAEEAGSVAPGEPEDAGPPGDEECAPEKGKGKGKGHPKNDGPKVAPADKAKYAFYLKESGLADFKQHVDPRKKEPGHVEYTVLERRAGERDQETETGGPGLLSVEEDPPEKAKIQELVLDLRKRHFSFADIAVLTYKNEDVAAVSSWLNEKDIPFIPFSSLDVRKRRVIAEILALLQFLDSPPDDLSFATFLLGELFRAKVAADVHSGALAGVPAEPGPALAGFLFECRANRISPLYPAFRKRFPVLWDGYIERFFKIVGYYPLYDLVTLIYRMFDVFDLFGPEEASLTRLLEAIKDFEGQGRNDLREFLKLSGDAESDHSGWTIDVPLSIEAVKVMSIHKSKGLTFPAVILLQYPGRSFRPDFFFERGGDSVRVLKLSKDMAVGDAVLGPIYDEAYLRDKVGSFNALYVALTRAADELHVLGVKGPRMGFPFDFLGTEPFISKHSPTERLDPSSGRPYAPHREAQPAPRLGGTLHFRELFELPVNLREKLNREGIRRGEIAHALLAEVEYLGPDPASDLAAAQARLAVAEDEAPVYEEVRSRLAGFLSDLALRPYFERRPGRSVRTELEVCDRAGRLRRLDRVVLDTGEVFVLEYKTGFPSEPGRRKDWEEEDRQVFASYLALMKEIHPGREVHGAFAFIDPGTVEVIA